MLNISASFTCTKCGAKFRAKFPEAKEEGCNCGAVYEKLTHIPIAVFDSREQRSGVPAECESIGMEVVIFPNLEVGDIVVSDRVGMESKVATDLLADWITNRELFSKLHDLKMAYSKPILLFRGYTSELFEVRGIDPAKVQACLFTIARMGIPLIETLNVAGTARAIKWFAEKEQSEEKRLIQLHGKRSHLSPNAQLEYIISASPGIGRGTAILLLNEFKTIEGIATASVEELQKIKGIDKTANSIREVMTRRYNGGTKK